MEQVIVGFSRPKKFMIGAEIIRLWEHNSEFCHVYMRVYTSIADRNLVYQAGHGYVHCETYDNFLEHNQVVAEFSYNVDNVRYKMFLQYCMDMLERPYSYMGLLVIGLKRLVKIKGDGDKGFVCSEFVARSLPEFYKADPDLASPLDLYNVLKWSSLVKRLK